MKPWRITFTGIEASCELSTLLTLARSDSRVEFGILYSLERAGRGRYPNFEWINTGAKWLNERGVSLALHVCGGAVKRFLQDGVLPGISIAYFDRVQLNGTLNADRDLLTWRINLLGRSVITQLDANPGLFANTPAHQLLFDASGGRGVAREAWPAPVAGRECGYAGGLSAQNLPDELLRISQAAGTAPYWVDMETGLRDAQDAFSLPLTQAALCAIKRTEAQL
jgi:hypothetical protein